MTFIDLKIKVISMECCYDLSESDLINCKIEDIHGIERVVPNVSFVYVDSKNSYKSSMFYQNLGDPSQKQSVFKYDFDKFVLCEALGCKSVTIKY